MKQIEVVSTSVSLCFLWIIVKIKNSTLNCLTVNFIRLQSYVQHNHLFNRQNQNISRKLSISSNGKRFSSKTCTIKCSNTLFSVPFSSTYATNSQHISARQVPFGKTTHVPYHMLFRIQFISSSLLSHHLNVTTVYIHRLTFSLLYIQMLSFTCELSTSINCIYAKCMREKMILGWKFERFFVI